MSLVARWMVCCCGCTCSQTFFAYALTLSLELLHPASAIAAVAAQHRAAVSFLFTGWVPSMGYGGGTYTAKAGPAMTRSTGKTGIAAICPMHDRFQNPGHHATRKRAARPTRTARRRIDAMPDLTSYDTTAGSTDRVAGSLLSSSPTAIPRRLET